MITFDAIFTNQRVVGFGSIGEAKPTRLEEIIAIIVRVAACIPGIGAIVGVCYCVAGIRSSNSDHFTRAVFVVAGLGILCLLVDVEEFIIFSTNINKFIQDNNIKEKSKCKDILYPYSHLPGFSDALDQVTLLFKDSAFSDTNKIDLVKFFSELDIETVELFSKLDIKTAEFFSELDIETLKETIKDIEILINYGFVKNVDLEKIKLCTKIVRFIKQNSLMNTLENKSEIYEHLQQANFSAALEQASLLIKDSTVSDNSKINLVATLANLDAHTSEQITQQIVKIKKDIPALCKINQSMILKAILEIPSVKLEECLEFIVKRFSDLDNSELKTLFIVPLYEIEELDKFVQDLNLDQPYLAIHSLHYLSKEDQQKALNLFKSLALGIDDKIKRDIIFKIVSSVPNLINGDLTQLNESFKSICTEETTMEDLSYLWMFIAILPEGDRNLFLDDPEGFRDSSKNYLTKLIEDGLAADKHRSEWMFMGNQFKKPEFFKKLLKCFYFHVLDSKSPYFDLDGDSPINQFDVILEFLKECNTEASSSIASRLSNYVYNSKTSSPFKLFLNGTSSELIIRGSSTTHAFLYHIVKDQSGKTHFKVYDSGGNFSRYEGTGIVVFENIEPKLINEKFLYKLLEFKHSTGEVVNWINKYFESYSPLHKPFKPQKHGSCSYKCFSKFLHAEMGDLEYLKFKVFLTEKHISIVESMLAKLAPISKKEFEKMKKEGQEVLVKRKRKLSDLQGQSNNSVLVR